MEELNVITDNSNDSCKVVVTNDDKIIEFIFKKVNDKVNFQMLEETKRNFNIYGNRYNKEIKPMLATDLAFYLDFYLSKK